ncbi:hypothetical protein RB195_017007 [Necator americanus]
MCPKTGRKKDDVLVNGHCFELHTNIGYPNVPLCTYNLRSHPASFFVAKNQDFNNRCTPYKKKSINCFCSSYIELCSRYVWAQLPYFWIKNCHRTDLFNKMKEQKWVYSTFGPTTISTSTIPTRSMSTGTASKKTPITLKTKSTRTTRTTTTTIKRSTSPDTITIVTAAERSTYLTTTKKVKEKRTVFVSTTSTAESSSFSQLNTRSVNGETTDFPDVVDEISPKERILRDQRKKILNHSTLLLLILSSIMTTVLVVQLVVLRQLRRKLLSDHKSGITKSRNKQEKKSPGKGKKKNVIHHDEEEKNKQKDATADNDNVTDLYALSRIGLHPKTNSKEGSTEGKTR